MRSNIRNNDLRTVTDESFGVIHLPSNKAVATTERWENVQVTNVASIESTNIRQKGITSPVTMSHDFADNTING